MTLFFGGILFLVTKDMRRSMEEWISRIAAAGGCSEGEMREFDNQAVEPDSLIVNLLGKIKAVTAGQKSGILTRDYIELYNSGRLGVLKVSRITGAYLTDNVYNVKVGNSIKTSDKLVSIRCNLRIPVFCFRPQHCKMAAPQGVFDLQDGHKKSW